MNLFVEFFIFIYMGGLADADIPGEFCPGEGIVFARPRLKGGCANLLASKVGKALVFCDSERGWQIKINKPAR
jgi:hypothetical protein